MLIKLGSCQEWILNIGDGKVGEPNDGEIDVEIPHETLIDKEDDLISAIVESRVVQRPGTDRNLNRTEMWTKPIRSSPRSTIIPKSGFLILSRLVGPEFLLCSKKKVYMLKKVLKGRKLEI